MLPFIEIDEEVIRKIGTLFLIEQAEMKLKILRKEGYMHEETPRN